MKKAFIIVFLVIIIAGTMIVKAHDNYTLVELVKNNDYTAVKRMLEKGYDPNVYKYIVGIPAIFDFNPTPLVAACRNGNVDMVELLISNGANVNKMDKYTKTPPLHAALMNGGETRFRIVKTLIENGANYNNTENVSPLQETIFISQHDTEETIIDGFELFCYLINNGADMKMYRTQENALTFAVRCRNHRVVEYLLTHHYFSVDSYDGNDNTPLIVAVKESNAEMVRILLEHGADATKTDASGKTAYDYAAIIKDDKIVRMLKELTKIE